MKNNIKGPLPKVMCRDCKWHNEKGCWFLSDNPNITVDTKQGHGCNQGRSDESPQH